MASRSLPWPPVTSRALPCPPVAGTNRNVANGHLTSLGDFQNGLIQIRTEKCPNEAIWKQICHSFGMVYPSSKVGADVLLIKWRPTLAATWRIPLPCLSCLISVQHTKEMYQTDLPTSSIACSATAELNHLQSSARPREARCLCSDWTFWDCIASKDTIGRPPK